jgi:hypothetical protein
VLDDFLATAEASAPAADEADLDGDAGAGEPGLDDRVIDP